MWANFAEGYDYMFQALRFGVLFGAFTLLVAGGMACSDDDGAPNTADGSTKEAGGSDVTATDAFGVDANTADTGAGVDTAGTTDATADAASADGATD